MHRIRGMLVGALTVCLFPAAAMAAQNAYIYFRNPEIQGDSTVHSMDRENSIEASHVRHDVQTKRHGPFIFRHRIGRASPLLLQQLVTRGRIAEVEIRFFRPNPAGDGTTEQYYTIMLTGVRITKIATRLPNTLDPASATLPVFEEVAMTYEQIEWRYMPNGSSTSARNAAESRRGR